MTAYTLNLHKQVKKFLQSLNPDWRARFLQKLEMLRQNARAHTQLDIKPMQGAGEGVYRLWVVLLCQISGFLCFFALINQSVAVCTFRDSRNSLNINKINSKKRLLNQWISLV
ncbi:MAG: hypothetical protein CTY17_08305 [Methylomonas sp.]|nr:MAG: hypothetical protein CTY23_04595 [Methylomonas sp.]PPD39307.1 MAG: hypothetical protein CTY17_08305 [Methylomonas sp.]